MNRASLITLIHVAKRDLQLDHDTYTSALLAATGKSSCRDMSPGELSRVLDVFKKRGFKVRQKPVNRALKPGTGNAARTRWPVPEFPYRGKSGCRSARAGHQLACGWPGLRWRGCGGQR